MCHKFNTQQNTQQQIVLKGQDVVAIIENSLFFLWFRFGRKTLGEILFGMLVYVMDIVL